ncbi:hypothetical protein EX30DRAFT_254637 [Ascodesmis nigricans]|uniref:Uncharacterized protein n=1 Tax=Ascodesmis nigricans TaxID=341454 RepID=A0A4S2MYE4_9PEZI|nr:hypothetical protein EX30DRAFT_254637 [Ascodesmis nigricans]
MLKIDLSFYFCVFACVVLCVLPGSVLSPGFGYRYLYLFSRCYISAGFRCRCVCVCVPYLQPVPASGTSLSLLTLSIRCSENFLHHTSLLIYMPSRFCICLYTYQQR